MEILNVRYKDYVITTDKSLMQVEAIHKWLSEESYWAKDIPLHFVKTTFHNSYCAGILKDGKQVGYCRLVTDYAVFGYLADVYVLEEHRKKGLANKMIETILNQDWALNLRKLLLATLDAHDVYKGMGFNELAIPERYMEISRIINYKELADVNNTRVNK